ncbi:L-lysine exporter family protein LysE/ArgO [Actinoalloteichus hoggarensis]|uniref:Arginine exporter protein ArgO n=1 Tax=Actinoalloteichus hoggarensis TaxID=1470176 RepID=A0A221W6G1_9PSEU|nr:LysE/ArgO family amino acid transporter [Actinoalloteichus hoggarensis]ASO21324.1 Arginine exporter protein ArgO [Actinoalloteichus hoggarensis]MBB5921257.1 L-lysine exporter family protein LysE/ArgO [Actinoalloteichus hoggarensis]
MPVLPPVAAGLGAGLSLIVAIGAQNAFVLRQGILRRHVLSIVLICVVSDVVLIALGVAGVTAMLERIPVAVIVVRWLGAAFLLGYGLLAARRALRPASLDPASAAPVESWRLAVLTCLAVTWLNPHTYLDTVLLLGAVGDSWQEQRWWFGAGAMAGSALWFTALGFGAGLLRGFFGRPGSWRLLDSLVAATMLTLAGSLIIRGG